MTIFLSKGFNKCACGVLIGLSMVVGADCTAADELVTDRPDQTESAVVVGPGRYQLEVGMTFTRDDEAGIRSEVFEGPGTLLRIGLTETVELRLGMAGYLDEDVRSAAGRQSENALGDGEIGLKWVLANERGRRPQMAVLVSTSVPIGGDAFTSDEFDPEVRLALSHTLTDRVGLGYNLGVGWESSPGTEPETVASYFYTVALGIALSERWGFFLELYGSLADEESVLDGAGTLQDIDDVHAFDGGWTYALTDRMQLDLAAGLGLSDSADDRFISLGLSIRWPD